jgi:hypothetical protein
MDNLSEDENKQNSPDTHNDVQPDKDSSSLNDSQSNPSVAGDQPEISHSFSPAQNYTPQPAPNNLNLPPAYPAPMISNPSAQPTTPQNQVDNHSTNALTIIIQWLTYAFWGWTVLILSILTYLVFAQLLNSTSSSSADYYVISAAIVLLPISFVTDFFYSKKEPKKKESAAMVVMVIHAVLFALFGIGALISAVFSFVSLLTSSGSHTSTYVSLWSAIFITIFYAATFIRTINPAKLPWISKAYKIFMLVVILLFILLGFLKPQLATVKKLPPTTPAPAYNNPSTTPTVTIGGPGALQPTLPGGGQCGASTNYAQIAISGGATCTTAEAVVQAANGSNFSSNGYSCSVTKEGSNTQWSSYWSGTFYAYTCSNSSNQIAFNWQ